MASFINVEPDDRLKIYDRVRKFEAECNDRDERDANAVSDILFMDGDKIDVEQYGFAPSPADKNGTLNLLRTWYMHKGMSETDILSGSLENMSRKRELTEEFHRTFSRQPEDTDETLRQRRMNNLMNMHDTLEGLPLAAPPADGNFSPEMMDSYLNVSYLYGNMAAGLSDAFYSGEFSDTFNDYIGAADPDDFSALHKGNLMAHVAMGELAASFADVFGTSSFLHSTPMNEATAYFDSYESQGGNRINRRAAERVRNGDASAAQEPTFYGNKITHLKDSLDKIRKYEYFCRLHGRDSIITDSPVRDNIAVSGAVAGIFSSDLSSYTNVPGDYGTFGSLFLNEYNAPTNIQPFDNNSRDPNAINISSFFMGLDNEALIREITQQGSEERPIEALISDIYINGVSLKGEGISSVARQIREALCADNEDILTVGSPVPGSDFKRSFRPVFVSEPFLNNSDSSDSEYTYDDIVEKNERTRQSAAVLNSVDAAGFTSAEEYANALTNADRSARISDEYIENFISNYYDKGALYEFSRISPRPADKDAREYINETLEMLSHYSVNGERADILFSEETDPADLYNNANELLEAALQSGNLYTNISGRIRPLLPDVNRENIDMVRQFADRAVATAEKMNEYIQSLPENVRRSKDNGVFGYVPTMKEMDGTRERVAEREARAQRNESKGARYNEYIENSAYVKNARAIVGNNPDSFLPLTDSENEDDFAYISRITGTNVTPDMSLTDAVAVLNRIKINGVSLYGTETIEYAAKELAKATPPPKIRH